jgi:hypothetical protein
METGEMRKGTLSASMLQSQKFGIECVKLIVGIYGNHLIIHGGVGPGSANETRLLYTSP